MKREMVFFLLLLAAVMMSEASLAGLIFFEDFNQTDLDYTNWLNYSSSSSTSELVEGAYHTSMDSIHQTWLMYNGTNLTTLGDDIHLEMVMNSTLGAATGNPVFGFYFSDNDTCYRNLGDCVDNKIFEVDRAANDTLDNYTFEFWINTSTGEIAYKNVTDGWENITIIGGGNTSYFKIYAGGGTWDIYVWNFTVWSLDWPNLTDYGTNKSVPGLNDEIYLFANASSLNGIEACVFDAVDPNNNITLDHENATVNTDNYWNSTGFNANVSGLYWYNITCYDSLFNTSVKVESGFSTDDVTPPGVLIDRPLEGEVFSTKSNIPLDVIWIDATGLRTCKYSLDNGTSNTTFSCGVITGVVNTTFSVGVNGAYTVQFWGEDYGSNWGEATANFSVNEVSPPSPGGGGGINIIERNISAESQLKQFDVFVFPRVDGSINWTRFVGVNKEVKDCQILSEGFSCTPDGFGVQLHFERDDTTKLYEVIDLSSPEDQLLIVTEDDDAVRMPVTLKIVNYGWYIPVRFSLGGYAPSIMFETGNDNVVVGVRVWWLALLGLMLLWYAVERHKTRNNFLQRAQTYKRDILRRLS